MKTSFYALTLAIMMSLPARAQNSAQQPQSPSPQAASATQDNSAAGGDKLTKPAGAKSSTIIGCLSGPDSDGRYTLRSMEHRTGLQVLGPDELKKESGSKVKLTGWWIPGDQPATKGKETRKFQVSEAEVLAQKCTAPSETTPISKKKQEEQQQKQQQQKSSASGSEDASNPK